MGIGLPPCVCSRCHMGHRKALVAMSQLDARGKCCGHTESDDGCGQEEAWAHHHPRNVSMVIIGEAEAKIGRGVIYSKLCRRNALCCSVRRAPSSSGAAAGFVCNFKSPKTKQSVGNAWKCPARSDLLCRAAVRMGRCFCKHRCDPDPQCPGGARSRASPHWSLRGRQDPRLVLSPLTLNRA